MNKVTSKELLYKIVILGLIMSAIGYLSYGICGVIIHSPANPDDFTMRYRECRYLLAGINPFDVMKGNRDVIENIGPLWTNGGAVPWALGGGIFLNFAFLQERYARICALVLTVVIWTYTLYTVWQYSKKLELTKVQRILIVLSVGALPGWGTGIFWLNYGNIFAGLFIITILNFKNNKESLLFYIALSIASMKPQLALPFYFALLYKKNWKGLIISSIFPLICWAFASKLVNTNPIILFKSVLETGAEYDTKSIFRTLQYFFDLHYSFATCDTISSIGCIIGVCYFWKRLKNKSNNSLLLFYTVPAVFSGMWMYMLEHDRVVIGFLVIVIIIFLIKTEGTIYPRILVSALIFTWIYPYFFNTVFLQIINKEAIAIDYIFVFTRYFLQICSLLIICETLTNVNGNIILKGNVNESN